MARPATTPFQEQLYSNLEPLARDDAALDWPLLKYCGAIAKMFDQVEELARDRPTGEVGWSMALDPNVCPPDLLPWLAQFVGVNLPESASDVDKRAMIVGAANFKRGTPASLQAAVLDQLTGTKTLYFSERRGGNAYQLMVSTKASETPNPAAVVKALLEQKPAGIVLDYSTIAGNDYASLDRTHDDYADVLATYADYTEVVNNPTKQ